MLKKFIFCLLLACGCLRANAQYCNPADSMQLVSLYNSTNGAGWTNPWNLGQPVSSWWGVGLDGDGRVIGIALENQNLVGSIDRKSVV